MAGDSFDGLTPDIIIDAAETALNCRFEGVTIPLSQLYQQGLRITEDYWRAGGGKILSSRALEF